MVPIFFSSFEVYITFGLVDFHEDCVCFSDDTNSCRGKDQNCRHVSTI